MPGLIFIIVLAAALRFASDTLRRENFSTLALLFSLLYGVCLILILIQISPILRSIM